MPYIADDFCLVVSSYLRIDFRKLEVRIDRKVLHDSGSVLSVADREK